MEFKKISASQQGNTRLCKFARGVQIALPIVVSGNDRPFRKELRYELFPWNPTIPVIKRGEKTLNQRVDILLVTKIVHRKANENK